MAFIKKKFTDGHEFHTVEQNDFLKQLYLKEDSHQEKFYHGNQSVIRLPRNPIVGGDTPRKIITSEVDVDSNSQYSDGSQTHRSTTSRSIYTGRSSLCSSASRTARSILKTDRSVSSTSSTEIEQLAKRRVELQNKLQALNQILDQHASDNKTSTKASRLISFYPSTYRELRSSRPMVSRSSRGYLEGKTSARSNSKSDN